MNDDCTFVVESGIAIYPKSPRNRNGKWKDLAAKMALPKKDSVTGEMIYDSVSHSLDGKAITNKEATALCNQLRRIGAKSVVRKNGNGGFRVWRVT